MSIRQPDDIDRALAEGHAHAGIEKLQARVRELEAERVQLGQAWWLAGHAAQDLLRRCGGVRLAERLSQLDRETRGAPERCVCTAAPHHDMRCPARRP